VDAAAPRTKDRPGRPGVVGWMRSSWVERPSSTRFGCAASPGSEQGGDRCRGRGSRYDRSGLLGELPRTGGRPRCLRRAVPRTARRGGTASTGSAQTEIGPVGSSCWNATGVGVSTQLEQLRADLAGWGEVDDDVSVAALHAAAGAEQVVAVLELARTHGMSLLARSPLAMGLLSGSYSATCGPSIPGSSRCPACGPSPRPRTTPPPWPSDRCRPTRQPRSPRCWLIRPNAAEVH
jgi:hypothetical protein